MKHLIAHMDGIIAGQRETSRLRTHVLSCGPPQGRPVLFLHGNLSSSTFWEETMLTLPARFSAVAPDLRGYGLSDPERSIDATRGVADWADDVVALADDLGWDKFHVVAHSLGGCVAWAVLAQQAERISSVTFVAPGPPCGFGGARGERGELNHADGAGSGAALVHPQLVQQLASGNRDVTDELFSPQAVMNRLYWKPPFRPAREEQLLTAMLQVHLGPERFPGDWRESQHWPGFAPGSRGPINAISPRYNQWILPRLIENSHKPPVLWIRGEDDPIVCDASPSDAGMQGKLRLRPDWPGDDVFPPQPALLQVGYAFDQYEQAGGFVARVTLPGVGHTPYLEQPIRFRTALLDLLQADA